MYYCNPQYAIIHIKDYSTMDHWVLQTLRNLRREKDYSQEYLSLKLEISQSYYARIENGKAALTIKTFHQILAVLEIDCIDFYHKIKLMETVDQTR